MSVVKEFKQNGWLQPLRFLKCDGFVRYHAEHGYIPLHRLAVFYCTKCECAVTLKRVGACKFRCEKCHRFLELLTIDALELYDFYVDGVYHANMIAHEEYMEYVFEVEGADCPEPEEEIPLTLGEWVEKVDRLVGIICVNTLFSRLKLG